MGAELEQSVRAYVAAAGRTTLRVIIDAMVASERTNELEVVDAVLTLHDFGVLEFDGQLTPDTPVWSRR